MKVNRTIFVVATNRSHYDRIVKVLKDAGYSWVWTPSCDLSYSKEYDVIEISPDMIMDRSQQSSDLTYTNIDFLLPDVVEPLITIRVNQCDHKVRRPDLCKLLDDIRNDIIATSSTAWLIENNSKYNFL